MENKEPVYRRSFEEASSCGEELEERMDEFAKGTFDEVDLGSMSDMSRRRFLGLMGATAAFAGTACSNYRDPGAVVPYNEKPVSVTPGKPNYYASTCDGCQDACGLLVKTREGRPIKVDGNDKHPVNLGKICSQGQTSVISLYDPDRIRTPFKSNGKAGFDVSDWDSADAAIRKAIEEAKKTAKKVVVVTDSVVSPFRKYVLDRFSSFAGNLRIINLDILNSQSRSLALQKAYKKTEMPVIDWDRADVILSVDFDLIGKGKNLVETTRKYTSRKDSLKAQSFNRLYCVEGAMTLSGMNSDYRLRLRPDFHREFLLSLLSEIVLKKRKSSFAQDPRLLAVLKEYDLQSFAKNHGMDIKILNYMVSDLISKKSLVWAGDHHSEDVHLAAFLLNEVLGSLDLFHFDLDFQAYPFATNTEVQELVAQMKSGNIAALIHLNTNPAFVLPSDFGYEEAMEKVPMVISFALIENETTRKSHWVLPLSHSFESWGDAMPRKGVLSLRQPVIQPLFKTRQWEESLLSWVEGKHSESLCHNTLKTFWREKVHPFLGAGSEFEKFWFAALHDGVVTWAEASSRPMGFQASFDEFAKKASSVSELLVQLTPSYHLRDGRFANIGWLQELDHPVSRIVWDNYAAMSKKTAKKLGVSNNDLLRVKIDSRSQILPVFIQPGMADDMIHTELGYGRKVGGTVGSFVGVNTIELLSKDRPFCAWNYLGSAVKVEGEYKLATTQGHWAYDDKLPEILRKRTDNAPIVRGVVHGASLVTYEKDPQFLAKKMETKRSHIQSLYTEEHTYPAEKWAMSIDLNRCTGCQECTIACNVENNIPVVGKEQVSVSREMHWIRIDRFYAGPEEDPSVYLQPMLCQHCDNAPCENVCPVAATDHSPDGLNGMAYNRCVGTRYCANNCPFKVRRFNFLNFRRQFKNAYQQKEPLSLANNPEVSVRSRGVMEKCTFCVQRIMDARQMVREEKRALADGDIKTACQEACPANAIVFGDSNNKASEVNKRIHHNLEYKVLEELMVRPNVTYLARLKNIHEEVKS